MIDYNNIKKLDLDPDLYPDIWTFENWYEKDDLDHLLKMTEESREKNWQSFGESNWGENTAAVRKANENNIGDRIVEDLEVSRFNGERYLRLFYQYGPVKYKNYRVKPKERLQIVAPQYNYPTHTDSHTKLMSMIVYVHGYDGTIFRGKEDSDDLEYEIKFKKNSGYFFFPDEKTTWHRFENKSNDIRSTTVINIVSK